MGYRSGQNSRFDNPQNPTAASLSVKHRFDPPVCNQLNTIDMSNLFKNLENISLDLLSSTSFFSSTSKTREIERASEEISELSEELRRLSIPISQAEEQQINEIIHQIRIGIGNRQENQILTSASRLINLLRSKYSG
jgi:histidinol-phosphate/aromatic aminotransferase/cobyric acid decarboxylase-like protein